MIAHGFRKYHRPSVGRAEKSPADKPKANRLFIAPEKLTFWRYETTIQGFYLIPETWVGCFRDQTGEKTQHFKRGNESPALYIQHGKSMHMTNTQTHTYTHLD